MFVLYWTVLWQICFFSYRTRRGRLRISLLFLLFRLCHVRHLLVRCNVFLIRNHLNPIFKIYSKFPFQWIFFSADVFQACFCKTFMNLHGTSHVVELIRPCISTLLFTKINFRTHDLSDSFKPVVCYTHMPSFRAWPIVCLNGNLKIIRCLTKMTVSFDINEGFKMTSFRGQRLYCPFVI